MYKLGAKPVVSFLGIYVLNFRYSACNQGKNCISELWIVLHTLNLNLFLVM
jgi:hypothetical protein